MSIENRLLETGLKYLIRKEVGSLGLSFENEHLEMLMQEVLEDKYLKIRFRELIEDLLYSDIHY